MIWPFKKTIRTPFTLSDEKKESPFAMGETACSEGKNFYENPFVTHTSVIQHFVMWQAGWCAAKQRRQKNEHLSK